MDGVLDILSFILLATGGAFYVVGAIGLLRMPDFFTRMHAVSVSDTLGAGLIIAGLIIQAGPTLVAAKLAIIMAILLYTGSVATHALARAALQDGQKPLIASPDGRLVPVDAETAVVTLDSLVQPGGERSSKP